MKKIAILGVMLSVLASLALAQSVTNHGIVSDVATYESTATDTRVLTSHQPESIIANRHDRRGLIVAHWSAAGFGGTNSANGIPLNVKLPDNAILHDQVYVDITQAITPATATNRITLNNQNATNVLYTIKPVAGAVAVDVHYTNLYLAVEKTTNENDIVTYFTGSSATQGAFTVYIPYTLGLSN